MKRIVITDIHCGSPIELMSLNDLMATVLENLKLDYSVYMIGDNLDLAGCKPSMVNAFKAYRKKFQQMENVFWIDGNHERSNPFPEYIIVDKTILAHGDFEKWGLKKSKLYRSKPHGASTFKRKFIIPMIEWAEQFGVNRVTRKMKKNVYELLTKHDCDTYICGHVHPKKKLDIKYKGKTIIVLPRGVIVL